ncbi:MAG: protein kinase [Acidobacteria bacterium]|nr:protein kinase [Acidobacteriota bacterium]
MAPQRWQQIKDLLQAASERAPTERIAWLTAQCGDDAELRQEVESLLAVNDTADDFMRRPLVNRTTFPPLNATGELSSGQTVGPYRIEQRIGAGGMGVVYRAHDSRLGRPVALKLLPAVFTYDVERLRRFRQEARAVSALNHPNILTIHEIGEAQTSEGTAHFIATEFVEGRNLRTALQDGDLTLGFVLDVLRQTATALAAAHAAGVVHRDIKPENLMVRPDGLVKVLDFGLAKMKVSNATTAFSTVHTHPGLVMGTVNYMSPEQARGLETDESTDVFSLGVVAYELLTGRTPFAGATTGDVLAALLEREPPPLHALAPHLPASLPHLINRALAKDCAARYPHCAALLADLKVLQQELELAALMKRSNDTPASAISLSLRVGHSTTEKSAAAKPLSTNSAPMAVTAAVTKPNIFRRLSQPVRWAAISALVLLLLAGWALYRYVPGQQGKAIHSVAVLPFTNVGADPEAEYLSDGLTESLMWNLQHLPALRVMARSTVFTYKGRAVDPREVGEQLKVRALVMGEVKRQASQIIIRVELVDAQDGSRLWGRQFEPRAGNLPAAQSEIAREVAQQLGLKLGSGGQRFQAQPDTVNQEAYQLYLQGKYLANQRTAETLQASIEHYQRAIGQDPGYALAHAALAANYSVLPSYSSTSGREAAAAARASAATALALNPQLSEPHSALGYVWYSWEWDFPQAEQEFQLALRLNPNDATAHRWYAFALAVQGRLEEALQEAQRARELDPLSSSNYSGLSRIYCSLDQPEAALRFVRQGLNLALATSFGIHVEVGLVHLQLAPYDEALAAFRQAVALGEPYEAASYIGLAYALSGRRAEAARVLNEVERRGGLGCIPIAEIHAALGQRDQAFVWLQRALERREETVVWAKINPRLAGLRQDIRFQQLLRDIGLKP